MVELRTPEQVAADDALTAAIEQVHEAYSEPGDDKFFLMEYVVITSGTRIADDGEVLTAVGILYRDGDVPMHRALGLVEFGRCRLKKVIANDDE